MECPLLTLNFTLDNTKLSCNIGALPMITTLSIIIPRIMTLSIMTHTVIVLRIMILSRMPLSIMPIRKNAQNKDTG
jgi:hypothetical protein